VVNQVVAMLGTEGADEYIDRPAYRDALIPQQSIVPGRQAGHLEADHLELSEGLEDGGNELSLRSDIETLHDLAVNQISNPDRAVPERVLDFLSRGPVPFSKVFDPC
jgi:hypothetical protein